MKKALRIALASILALSVIALSGCNNKAETSSSDISSSEEIQSTVSSSVETADTAKETETEPSSDKPAILVVSFGTSYNETREATIGAIENKIAEDYPDYQVRRAFTSQTIIDKLKKRDNIEIDNVEEALQRLVSDGVKTLIVQPTHLMSGYEYDDLAAAVETYKEQFDSVVLGHPLLTSDKDFDAVAAALPLITKEYNTEGTAIVFMGHGTEHDSNDVYTKLQDKLTKAKNDNYFIGTVEATPSLDDTIEAVTKSGCKKVVLQPLMVVAGDHANNDMAGEDDDSWASVFSSKGFEVECVLQGLGEFPEIQKIYSDHVGEAIKSLEK